MVGPYILPLWSLHSLYHDVPMKGGRTRECECTMAIGVNGHGIESFWALVGWYGSLVAPCGCGVGWLTRLSNVTDYRLPFLHIHVPYTHTTSRPHSFGWSVFDCYMYRVYCTVSFRMPVFLKCSPALHIFFTTSMTAGGPIGVEIVVMRDIHHDGSKGHIDVAYISTVPWEMMQSALDVSTRLPSGRIGKRIDCNRMDKEGFMG